MSEESRKSDREFDPRHRVVGAIILVLFAVIFLPMLLERDRNSDDVTGSAIEQEAARQEKVFVSTITPVEEGAAPAAAQPAPPPPAQAGPEPTPPAPAPESKPEPQPQQAPAAVAKSQPAAAKDPSPASAEEIWLVRIGTFSQDENAQRVVDDLKAKGFRPETSATETSKGQATRVWVGPFPDRDRAVSERSRILKETGYEGLVVPGD